MKNYKDLQNLKRDGQGRVVIDIHVNDDSNFLSPYSQKDMPIISEDVASFLENSTDCIPHKECLSLNFHSNCIDEQEQVVYKKAIKNYYNNRLVSAKRELGKSFLIAAILAVMGIITITVAQVIGYYFESVIWAEVIDIAAWVFLWEAVDIFVFRTRSLQLNKKRYLSFITMNIEYVSTDKQTNIEKFTA